MWELAEICLKRLKCVGNDLKMWENIEKSWKLIRCVGNGLTT